jgi:hypothetical protein
MLFAPDGPPQGVTADDLSIRRRIESRWKCCCPMGSIATAYRGRHGGRLSASEQAGISHFIWGAAIMAPTNSTFSSDIRHSATLSIPELSGISPHTGFQRW